MKKRFFILLMLLFLLGALTVSASAAELSAEEMAAATPITPGETIHIALENNEQIVYSIQTTQAGQILNLHFTPSVDIHNWGLCDANGSYVSISNYTVNSGIYTACTNLPGTYYLKPRYLSYFTGTMTVTSADNDSHEPNNTQETATALTSGQPVEMILSYGDIDWLVIETTEDGQDISA